MLAANASDESRSRIRADAHCIPPRIAMKHQCIVAHFTKRGGNVPKLSESTIGVELAAGLQLVVDCAAGEKFQQRAVGRQVESIRQSSAVHTNEQVRPGHCLDLLSERQLRSAQEAEPDPKRVQRGRDSGLHLWDGMRWDPTEREAEGRDGMDGVGVG